MQQISVSYVTTAVFLFLSATLQAQEISKTNDFDDFLNCRTLSALSNPLESLEIKEDPVRQDTRTVLIRDVKDSWELPESYHTEILGSAKVEESFQIGALLDSISIPEVSFANIPLGRALDEISRLSTLYDSTGKGVNLILSSQNNPKINITLRNLTLRRLLDLIAKSVKFEYEIEADVVIFYSEETNENIRLKTTFFPVPRATVIRMTGSRQSDFFSIEEEEKAIRLFFQKAGIDFESVNASLVFDGSGIFVTQTVQNLNRMRTILKHYTHTRQVQIEAKFMEVEEGMLEEIGFQWNISKGQQYYQTQTQKGQRTTLPSLADMFGTMSSSTGPGLILMPSTETMPGRDIPISNRSPILPNDINLGIGAPSIANILGVLDGWNVQLLINALEQQTGTNLMSAPKLTVLSGKTAQIVVAQELRYPESYGKIDSAVGMTKSLSNGGSAGVTITAGTPQNFTTRRVGVEMEVTPTVEMDGTISLRLKPEVTEFEGFIEYGGSSVAISNGSVVNVPSGFFQPIFSVRKIETEVNIANNYTLIMGGLTREETLTIHQKVPLLGDIPWLGRLFQKNGETTQKRNLLIFVTAGVV
jgi:general secretion pathway protein D